MTKEERKEYMKAWREANKEEHKEYQKAYYQAHKDEAKAAHKAWYQTNKEQKKAYREAHKEEAKAYQKAYCEAHKEEAKAYKKADLNSLGQTKNSIRMKSQRYLNKYGTKIKGYEIHHCCTYTEPYKFIYCSKETHLKIHQFLRDNNIDADSDHYEQIKHLLDENVITFGL